MGDWRVWIFEWNLNYETYVSKSNGRWNRGYQGDLCSAQVDLIWMWYLSMGLYHMIIPIKWPYSSWTWLITFDPIMGWAGSLFWPGVPEVALYQSTFVLLVSHMSNTCWLQAILISDQHFSSADSVQATKWHGYIDQQWLVPGFFVQQWCCQTDQINFSFHLPTKSPLSGRRFAMKSPVVTMFFSETVTPEVVMICNMSDPK